MNEATEKGRTLVALGARKCDYAGTSTPGGPCDCRATKSVYTDDVDVSACFCSLHAKVFVRWYRSLRHVNTVYVQNI